MKLAKMKLMMNLMIKLMKLLRMMRMISYLLVILLNFAIKIDQRHLCKEEKKLPTIYEEACDAVIIIVCRAKYDPTIQTPWNKSINITYLLTYMIF
jgi:hypothetical protein